MEPQRPRAGGFVLHRRCRNERSGRQRTALGKDRVRAVVDTEMAATSMFPPKAGQRKDQAADRSSSTDRVVSPGVELTRQQTMAVLEELFIYIRRCEAFWRFSDRLDKALNRRGGRMR